MPRKRQSQKGENMNTVDLGQELGLTLLSDTSTLTDVNYLPTDIPHWDRYAPLKFGSVVEIYGKLASGKSTAATHLIKQAQKFDLPTLLIDVEGTSSLENLTKLGIDPSKLFVIRPSEKNLTIESVTESINDVIKGFKKAEKPIMIIWDSLAATPTESQVGGQNRIGDVANSVATMTKVIGQSITNSNTLFVIINQAREDMNAFRAPGMPAPIESMGGHALKHWATLRLEVGKVKQQKDKRLNPITGKEEERYIGHVFRSKVKKSKLTTPNTVFDSFLISDPYKGLDFVENIYRTSVAVQETKNNYGFITSGAWRNYQPLDETKDEIKLRDAEWVPFLNSEEGQPILEELFIRQMLVNFPDWYAPLDNADFDITIDPKYAKLKQVYLDKQKEEEQTEGVDEEENNETE